MDVWSNHYSTSLNSFSSCGLLSLGFHKVALPSGRQNNYSLHDMGGLVIIIFILQLS